LYILTRYYPGGTYYPGAVGQVSAMRDGYYRLGTDGTITKIRSFVYGDIFLTPSGGLYCILGWKPAVMNIVSRKIME